MLIERVDARLFRISEDGEQWSDESWSASQMLEANADDEGLRAWIRNAKPCDTFSALPHGLAVRCEAEARA